MVFPLFFAFSPHLTLANIYKIMLCYPVSTALPNLIIKYFLAVG